MLEHGGNLRDAVKQFGRPLEDWVDISTGINPHYYPAPVLAANAWHRLPEYSDDLQHAAQAYYRAPHMLAVAGTQAAIQALPYLFLRQHAGLDTAANVRVAVSAPSYAEHAYQWRRAGTSVSEYLYADLENAIAQSDVVVLCNPNNPTGERIAPATLLRWAATLAPRGGWLIVDEAFADTEPELSVAAESQRPGLIVLRSVGKFFGLAGIRLGFVAAAEELLHALANQLGPWSISGPAQQIAIAALRDHAWQQATQARLATLGERLRVLLHGHAMYSSGTDLFQWCSHHDLDAQSEQLWQFMAQRGIWLRWFAAGAFRPHGVRFGLPATESAWQQLEHALTEWKAHHA